MGGAISLEDIQKILEEARFKNFSVFLEEVTDEYARKWGYGLEIKDYIASGSIVAYK